MELKLSTGTIAGQNYYTIYPVMLEWRQSNSDIWNSMVEWCVNTFGPTSKNGVWELGGRWYVNNTRFWFRDEQDQLLFVLRWQ